MATTPASMKARWMQPTLATLVVAALVLITVGMAFPNRSAVRSRPVAILPAIDLTVDRLHAPFASNGKIYGIEDHDLYVSVDTGRTFQRLGRITHDDKPLGAKLRHHVARHTLVRRVRRDGGPRSMTILRSGTILVFYDAIYRSNDGGRTFTEVPGTQQDRLPHPFPSSVGIAVGPGDTVVYGEYSVGPRPRRVRLIRGTDDGQRWEIAHTFPAGEVFHVHGVTYDPYRSRYWIATGDTGTEARLLYSADGLRSFQIAGCCQQQWRLVDMIVTEQALFWGSDDDHEQPAIYRFDPAGQITRLASLDNPSYHAAQLTDGTLAITTTHEPTSPFTRTRRPPASTTIWISRDGGATWHRPLTLEGDSSKMAEGKRPQIQLPAGDPLPRLFATPWFTETYDFTLLRLTP